MVEPGRAEPFPELRAQPFVLAEYDRRDDGTLLPAHARRKRVCNLGPDAIGDATEPAAAPDDRERTRLENDVDALAAQITRLVEAVFLRSRLVNLDDDPKEGALRRRRPAGRSSRARSFDVSSPNRRTRTGTRTPTGSGRLGPVTSSSAEPARPTSRSRTL